MAEEFDFLEFKARTLDALKDEVLAICSRHRPVTNVTNVDKGHGWIETRRSEALERGLIVDPEGGVGGYEDGRETHSHPVYARERDLRGGVFHQLIECR